jgi:hypothetical protein
MSQAEPPEANGPELDPIIDALLDHLPAPGDYFAMGDRKRWLAILELAFDMIYVEEATGVPPPNEPGHGGADV